MSEAMDVAPSFQFLTDASSGFAALSAGVLEGLRDEFGKAEVLYMTVEDRCEAEKSEQVRCYRFTCFFFAFFCSFFFSFFVTDPVLRPKDS